MPAAFLRSSALPGFAAAGLVLNLSISAAMADGDTAKPLSLELNKATDTQAGCLLTFVGTNKTGLALSSVAYELVLFDKDGLVDRMSAFDFGAMPAGKTFVRQFELKGSKCPGLSQILVNGAARCEQADPVKGAENTCISALSPASRTDIAFIK
ncbi:hypothetical protein [Roseibium litorale]|uniref:Tat pathway signal sequence domain protein n=1 Tax=Roseibium litorale TaxID=2803841 RepID=A0ABR9CG69_9HYPH|nr:hypothetical protein [Roseibium litorale]MBD8889921.1 hypothetical protein [Roseibium litorale]